MRAYARVPASTWCASGICTVPAPSITMAFRLPHSGGASFAYAACKSVNNHCAGKPLPTLQKNRPAAQQKNPLVRTHFNNAHPAAIRSSTRRRIKVMLRFKRPEYPKNLSTNLLRGHDAASRNFKTARAGKMPFPVSVIQRVDANAPTFRGRMYKLMIANKNTHMGKSAAPGIKEYEIAWFQIIHSDFVPDTAHCIRAARQSQP